MAGDAGTGLVTGWLASVGLTGGPLAVVQEPGASLEGTGQIDATQTVSILGRSCGSRSHGDSAVSSNRPGRAVSCRTVVGHGVDRELRVTC